MKAAVAGSVSSFCLLLAADGRSAHAQSFTGLGGASPVSSTYGKGVSADGVVAVGYYGGGGAFRWTRAGGIAPLGTLPGTTASYCEGGVSRDGSVVVGACQGSSTGQAFRWVLGHGTTGLGTLKRGDYSAAYSVSGDGSIVVGYGTVPNFRQHAFRWVLGGGMQDLGTLPESAGGSSWARAVSRDGAVVAGEVAFYNQFRAFRWTQSGGMVSLGTLAGGTTSAAAAVSADGSVVVGTADVPGPWPNGYYHAFRWTSAGGMVDLGLPSGSFRADAFGVSDDGAVVVGSYGNGGITDEHACLWTSPLGPVDLTRYLPTLGLDLTDWHLDRACAVSADGKTIVGTGRHEGQYEGWIAVLADVCYANCDGSGTMPALNAADFVCFLDRFAAGQPWANCDLSSREPTLNVDDFVCFLNRFAAGCP